MSPCRGGCSRDLDRVQHNDVAHEAECLASKLERVEKLCNDWSDALAWDVAVDVGTAVNQLRRALSEPAAHTEKSE